MFASDASHSDARRVRHIRKSDDQSRTVLQRRDLLEFAGGIAYQPNGSYDQRDDRGVGGALSVGRYVSPTLTYEARLAFNYFERPPITIHPCPLGPVCYQANANDVASTTLGVDAQFSSNHTEATSMAIAGGGLRLIGQSPAGGHEIIPYGEVGYSFNLPFGDAYAFTAQARIQASPARRDLPRWIVPITIGIRH